MLLNRLLGDVQKVPAPLEAKTIAVGLTKLVCETPEMLSSHHAVCACDPFNVQHPSRSCGGHRWLRLCGLPSRHLSPVWRTSTLSTTATRVMHCMHLAPSSRCAGYQVGFAKLGSSGKADHDPFADVADVKPFLAASLQQLSTQAPGRVCRRPPFHATHCVQIGPLVASALAPAAAEQLQAVLAVCLMRPSCGAERHRATA